MIFARGRSYSVRAAALPHIQAEIAEPPGQRSKTVSPSSKRRRTTDEIGAGSLLNQLIDKGFFKTPRTLKDVKERLDEMAHIFPVTSISPYLTEATRTKTLHRVKKDVGGKRVWVYKTKG